jgi:major membrane immunogen (membrane-anchored lipoprotein)
MDQRLRPHNSSVDRIDSSQSRRTSRWRVAVLVLPLVTFLLPVTAQAIFVGAAQAATQPLSILGADVIPGLTALAPLGATAPSTNVEVDVTLASSDPAGEAAYLASEYTPGGAHYHAFLTTQQVADQYGASQADYESALDFATANGMSLVRASNTRELIVLSGTVAQADKTFGVTIDNYSWHGLDFYADVNAPSVPAGLGITGVVGLNSAQVMKLDSMATARASHSLPGVKPHQTDCEAGYCVGATTPEDLWGAYDQSAVDEGQGESVAIFGEGDWTPPLQDLRDFEANPDQLTTCGGAGLPACADALPAVPVRVVEVDGQQASYTDTSGDEEWDIDTQASTGMAPDLQQLDLYFGTNLSDADVLNVVEDWASDPNGPEQASASYGECEYDPAAQQLPASDDFAAGQAMTVAYEQTMANANAEGRTLFSSAGDDGSSCPITPVDTNGVATQAFPDVNYPCSSPEVVCVGGTVLYTTGSTPNTRALETSWDDSGGGTSALFPEPSYQTPLNGASVPGPGNIDCAYNDEGMLDTTPTPCRGVPDIAAQSGDIVTNGYGIYYDGSATEEGGTSLSSPLSLGMWARVQAAAPAGGLGFANPVFYAHESDFYDIGNPSDSPASLSTTNGYFESTPGWDYVSGLGVMDVTKMTQAVDKTLTPTNDVPSPNTPTVNYYDGSLPGYPPIATPPPVDPACVSLFTGTTGESSYPPVEGSDYPNLDVLEGNMHNSATTLTTILTIEDMAEWSGDNPPGGTANEYYVKWDFGGTTYFTNAQVAATGDTFSYGDETFTGSTGTYTTVGTATGTIVDGDEGTITITVPLSAVGSPSVGANASTLTSPSSSVAVLVGTPPTGGELLTASDVSPEYDYTLNEVCGATGRPGSDGGGSTIAQTDASKTGTTTTGRSSTFTDQIEVTGNTDTPVSYVTTTTSPALNVSSSGAISTTGALAAGSYTVSGTDSDPNGDAGNWTFTLTVTAGAVIKQTAPTSAGTSTSGSGTFTDQLAVTGNTDTPVSYVTTTTSPALSVSSSGAIKTTGTLAAGTYTVSGTDSDPNGDAGSWTFTLTVTAGTITQTNASKTGTTTTAGSSNFTASLEVTGNTDTPVSYLTTTTSPALTVSSAGAIKTTGTLAAGTYTVSGTDSDPDGDTGSWTFTLTVTGGTISQTVASRTGVTTTGKSSTFTDQLEVTGNTDTPVSYVTTTTSASVTVSSTGAVSTTSALAAGSYTVSGTDSDPNGDTGSWSFTLIVTAGTVIIQTVPLSGSTTTGGSATFTDQLEVIGNTDTPVSYVTTTTSASLTVSSTGAVSTTGALAAGNYAVSGTDSDPNGDTGSWTFALTVTGGTITQTAASETGTTTTGKSSTFTDQLAVTGNSDTPVSYVTITTSPALSVSSSGAIKTTGTLAAGSYTVSGTDSDPNGDGGTWTFTLTVTAATITQTAASKTGATTPGRSSAFSASLAVTGNSDTPVTYVTTMISPALTVSPSGAISTTGTLAVGKYTVAGKDSDPDGDTGSWTFTLTVTAGTITQTAASKTATTTAGKSSTFTDHLEVTGNSDKPVSYVTTTTSPALSVSSSGAIKTTGTLAAGRYTVAGKDSDPNGDVGSWTFTLTVSGPPTITKVSPPLGPTSGGTLVSITGQNLSGGKITIGGIAVSSHCSATLCTFTTPAHSAGPVTVTVTTAEGSAHGKFTYVAPPTPTVTSVTPNKGPSYGGTTVTVHGTNFSPVKGTTTITVGGVAGTQVSCSSTTTCTVVTPIGLGSVDVRVTVARQTSPTTARDKYFFIPGYYLLGGTGNVYPFGDARNLGSVPSSKLTSPAVSVAFDPATHGYWVAERNGRVVAFGSPLFSEMSGRGTPSNIVAIASTPDGRGYWLVSSLGAVYPFGDARYYGEIAPKPLSKPVLGISPTPDGKGYFLLAGDGGIFTYGDAHFFGSTGGMHITSPVVAMSVDRHTGGYWLVAADGTVYGFNAPFLGDMHGKHLNRPMLGIASTPNGYGYYLVASDGGVFAFGQTTFFGSLGSDHLTNIVSMTFEG